MDVSKETIEVKVDVDSKVYTDSLLIFSILGLDIDDAVRSLLSKTSATKGIPFDLKLTDEEISELKTINNF